jgi:hypothetical protein
MSLCDVCRREMTKAHSCAWTSRAQFCPIVILGVHYEPIPYGSEPGWREFGIPIPARCHDYGVEIGGYHHPGCDVERCPACGGQWLAGGGCGSPFQGGYNRACLLRGRSHDYDERCECEECSRPAMRSPVTCPKCGSTDTKPLSLYRKCMNCAWLY